MPARDYMTYPAIITITLSQVVPLRVQFTKAKAAGAGGEPIWLPGEGVHLYGWYKCVNTCIPLNAEFRPRGIVIIARHKAHLSALRQFIHDLDLPIKAIWLGAEKLEIQLNTPQQCESL